MHADPEVATGVLITGVYGTGKSSVAAEIAVLLERQASRCAALDLDWLMWFDPGPAGRAGEQEVLLQNVRDVVRNYVAAGVRWFILAGAVPDAASLDALRAAVGFPLHVVRLTVPLEEIERRLEADVTTGRRDDLEVATEWLAAGTGVGIEELVVDNDGPIRAVASSIARWLGWTA